MAKKRFYVSDRRASEGDNISSERSSDRRVALDGYDAYSANDRHKGNYPDKDTVMGRKSGQRFYEGDYPAPTKKEMRDYEGDYAGALNKARRQETKDFNMINEDHNAVANLPQQVIYHAWPEPGYYAESNLDDTIRGINEQIDADGAGMRYHKSTKKY